MKASRHFDAFDRSTGSGSRSAQEDWLDENTTAAENEWSTAETTFYYWDADGGDQYKYRDLYRTHHGRGEQDRGYSIQRSHIVADAKTFAGVLELPDRQRNRVLSVAEDLDFSQFGGKPYEKILLAVCSLVFDEALSRDLDARTDSAAAEDRMICRDDFRQLMDATDLGSREHSRIRQMLREKVDEFGK